MGTVVEPPHPRDPVGTVGRAKRDSLPTPPTPASRLRTLRRESIDATRPDSSPSRIPVLGSDHPTHPQNTLFRV
jgi:hypothetical protein